MIAALPPYFYKMVMRIMLLGLAALSAAAVTGLVIVLPSSVLHGLGVVSFSLEDSALLGPVLGVGAVWSMAHTLDSIVEITMR